MICYECRNPLRIIKGGYKSEVGTDKITMVHVFGCINPNCVNQMKEVSREETEQGSFEE